MRLSHEDWRRHGVAPVLVIALALGLTACGGDGQTNPTFKPEASSTPGGALPASMVPAAATVSPTGARTATASSPELRARHLREYRQMIVALYRVPGAAALNAHNADPLDQLWLGLGRTYGPVLKPRPYPPMQSKAAAKEQRQAPMRRNRT